MVIIAKKTSAANRRRAGVLSRSVRTTMLFIIIPASIFIFKDSLLIKQNDIYSVDLIFSGSVSIDKEGCLSRVKAYLTSEEIASSLHLSLCSPVASYDKNQKNASVSPFPLADLVINDRTKIRSLERREYLRDLRSYRLSNYLCTDNSKGVPNFTSEIAFKCLPPDYKRRACMDGRVHFPQQSCSEYNNDGNPYVPELERSNIVQTRVQNSPEECRASVADGISKCNEIPMAKPGSSISTGQLAAGVPEAKVLTIKHGKPIWRKEALDFHLALIQQGKDVSPLDYPGSQQALQNAIEAVNVKDKSVAIFGSISPWVESIAHHNGAKSPTVTVDYNQPVSYDDRMKTELMSDMLESDTQFDIVISYSSIEHDGQGRYGDPLDPDGDLAAMKEVWLKVAPGGTLILNVPFDMFDNFFWYSMRTYGPSRLPLLIRGWEYGGLATSQKVYGPNENFIIMKDSLHSPVLILRKPETVGVDNVLDTTKFGGLTCDIPSTVCGLKLFEKQNAATSQQEDDAI